MPMPMPMMNEGHDEFMERCMADSVMQADFEDDDQRLAVCESQWEGSRKRGRAVERRFLPNDECPVAVETRDGEKPRIRGRAAVFFDDTDAEGTEFKLFDDLVERIHPRAFNKALNERHDVRALFNHDPNIVLGRTTSGTLKLTKSLRGLDYEIDPPDTGAGRDLLESIRRKDVTGSSFGFVVLEQKFEHDAERKVDIRTILSVELHDVSPVTFPAYSGTDVAVRSTEGLDEVRSAHAAYKASLAAEQAKAAELRTKLETYKARAAEVEA